MLLKYTLVKRLSQTKAKAIAKLNTIISLINTFYQITQEGFCWIQPMDYLISFINIHAHPSISTYYINDLDILFVEYIYIYIYIYI